MELAFYVAGAVAVISTILMLTRLNVVHALALPDRVPARGGGGLLHTRRPICGSARSDHLRGRHHGAFCFRGHDAQPGGARRRDGKTVADAGDLDRSCASGRHPYYRGRLFGAGRHRELGHWRGGTEGSWDSPVRSLPDWRGACLHAFAGGPGGRVSPGLPQSRKTGDSTWQRYP